MFKDIAVAVFNVEVDEPAIEAAVKMAEGAEADLTAVLLELQPDPVFTMEGIMVTSTWAEVLADARKGFAKEKVALEARAQREARPFAVREMLSAASLAAPDATMQARHADLTIMLRPGGTAPSDWRTSVFEGVLFGSGRPVLLIPPTWRDAPIGRNVVVAWNGKREAARALSDAAPLLENADTVTVLTVDARPSADGVGPAPGADIAAHLARRGLKVEVRNLDGLGHDAGEVLMEASAGLNGDLLVMGGYGRPRLHEWIFGGVTRAIIDRAQIPVLISH
jgi:nucleotide-binding universal stress UspA family protein